MASVIWTSCATIVSVLFVVTVYALIAFMSSNLDIPQNDQLTGSGPMVTTTSGLIEGINLTVMNKTVSAYLGIPYAVAPVGSFRFGRPEPVIKHRGVFKAKSQPISCMQFVSDNIDLPWNRHDLEQSENCLKLNIWTTASGNQSASKLKPIMVWIHGGGFVSGHISNPDFDGSVLSAFTDTVVAMMNYRLGVFGFLNLGHPDIEGNMGLYDQVLALKWIKENAKSFGGDANQITIFGESAGGVSVGYHLLSPLSRGLFKRAIMQSGTALTPTTLVSMNQVHSLGAEVTAMLGCNYTENKDNIVDCVRSMPMKAILKVQNEIITRKDDRSFSPSYYDDFLPENPIDMLHNGDLGNQSEVMMGYNRDEGSAFMYFANPKKFPGVGKNVKVKLNLTMTEIVSFASNFMKSQQGHTVRNLLENLYSDANDTSKETIFNKTRTNVAEFFVSCPSVFMAEDLANNNVSVYFYHFNHRPKNSPWSSWVGATHYDEVQFVFGRPLVDASNYTKEEVNLSKRLMKTWASFARTGKPGTEKLRWPKYTQREPAFVDIMTNGFSLVNKQLPTKHCNFWRLVYEVTHSQLERPTTAPTEFDEE
ncbi:Acetylcholinesterase-1 [Halotydeus destructor]|nr:Acetylcholinesterase-1 [Halotydeus destructor]